MDHDLWLVGTHRSEESLVVSDVAKDPCPDARLHRLDDIITYRLMTVSMGKFNEALREKTRTTGHKNFHP
ncbi:hypothetical protein AJ88_23905 [Mesorhizobium amorphae CCBAU 01583]|nr:hypothetical protein AJ88_23905 [Mesorhizobium amorphae CCBAU 01583]